MDEYGIEQPIPSLRFTQPGDVNSLLLEMAHRNR